MWRLVEAMWEAQQAGRGYSFINSLRSWVALEFLAAGNPDGFTHREDFRAYMKGCERQRQKCDRGALTWRRQRLEALLNLLEARGEGSWTEVDVPCDGDG